MAKRKVILFLVEGTSDLMAIAHPFAGHFSEHARVEGEAFFCDVTTVSLFPRDATFHVYRDVKETVRQFALSRMEQRRQYGWNDLDRIVHLVDVDGAFVDAAHVIQEDGLSRIEYGADSIRTSRRDEVVNRNEVKAYALRRLAYAGSLTYKKRSVPYQVYFMSRNLEHALFNIERDLDADDKERLSQAFAAACQFDPEYLPALLNDPAVRVRGDYRETWEHIQQGENSLKRGTNLALLLE